MFSDHEFWCLYLPCALGHGYYDFPVDKTVELGNTTFGAGFGLPWMEKTRYSTITQSMFDGLKLIPYRGDTIDTRAAGIQLPVGWWYNKSDKEYLSIDINGLNQSYKHDMQIELPEDVPKNYYNMLLDFGTIEHVRKQYMAWRNCHNLVKQGGLMVHSLPADRKGSWVDHCYHWYTKEFFEELAASCGYEIRLLDEVKVPQKDLDYQIWACLRKVHAGDFISEEKFLKIMERHVRSEYYEKSNGESRHGIPKNHGIDIESLGEV